MDLLQLLKKALPYIVRYLVDLVKNRKEENNMSTLKITVSNLNGTLAGAAVALTIPGLTTVNRITDNTGVATFSGLTSNTVFPVEVSNTGYIAQTISASTGAADAMSEISIKLELQTLKEIGEAAVEGVKSTTAVAKSVGDVAKIGVEAAVSDTVATAVDNVFDEIDNVIDEKQDDLKANIARTKNNAVKIRDSFYLQLLNVVEATADPLQVLAGAKALNEIQKFIDKL